LIFEAQVSIGTSTNQSRKRHPTLAPPPQKKKNKSNGEKITDPKQYRKRESEGQRRPIGETDLTFIMNH